MKKDEKQNEKCYHNGSKNSTKPQTNYDWKKDAEERKSVSSKKPESVSFNSFYALAILNWF